MPLEATMIILDNSEYMRNGDFAPSRLIAQSDAVNAIFAAKTQANPENTVGIMTMAGKTPQVLVTPTQDVGKVLSALHSLKVSGDVDITTGIQIAQLALKHRQNKNQRQRIVVFVGSPLATDEKSLVKLGKKLKKNNISIDVVSFGEGEDNELPLRAFVESVSSGDNSHLVSVVPGSHLLSDAIASSPILARDSDVPVSEAGVPGGAPTGSREQDFEFGVDPSLDPELAMALRMSMQEEQARRDAEAAVPGNSATSEGDTTSVEDLPAENPVMDEDDDDAQLAAALALSQGEDVVMADEADLDEQDEIARAIRFSNPEADEEGGFRK